MKQIKKILFTIFSLTIFISITNAEEITYVNEKNIDENTKNIICFEEKCAQLIENTTNSSITYFTLDKETNTQTQTSTKQYDSIINSEIIKNDNNIILIGTKNNNLAIYLIDQDNRIINSNISENIINNNDLKIKKSQDKIYVYQTKNNILASNDIYEINEKLEITKKTISELENIKDILKSEYIRLIKSGEIENSSISTYYSSTYTKDYNILVGKKDSKAIISLYDNDGILIWSKYDETNLYYKDVIIFNKTILALAYDGTNSKIVLYDYKGEKIKEILVEEQEEPKKVLKIENNIIINTKNNITIYNYDLKINTEESLYGTTTIIGEAITNNEIEVNVTPNSGYVLDSIYVYDDNDNLIDVTKNKFIMPNSSVTVKIVYGEIISNPDTLDPIYIVLIAFVIIAIIFKKLYEKYSWLKN